MLFARTRSIEAILARRVLRKEAQYRRNRKCDEVRVEAFGKAMPIATPDSTRTAGR